MLIRCAAEIERVLGLPFSKTSKGHALVWGRETGCPYVWANGQIRRSHLIVWLDGRDIPPGHLVHHEDGDKLNDKPGNLRVISQSVHSSHHSSNRSLIWGARVSEALKGRVVSEETRQKIALAGIGKVNAAGKRSGQALENIRAGAARREAERYERELPLVREVQSLYPSLSTHKIAAQLGISKDRVCRLLRVKIA